MADKELRRLKRRELLEMLLVQCQETERLQRERDEIQERFDEMSESYERLKQKLDIKDERLNQKDAKIAEKREQITELRQQITELRQQITELEENRAVDVAETGAIADATLKLNEALEDARRIAEQYLTRSEKPKEGNRVVPLDFGRKPISSGREWDLTSEDRRRSESFAAVSGGTYGR